MKTEKQKIERIAITLLQHPEALEPETPLCSAEVGHSPLPWYAHSGSGYVMRSEPGTVERVADCTGTGRSTATQAANAKLIVASVNHVDKLAEALRSTARELSWLDNPSTAQLTALNDSRAALAAWEGAKQ